MSCYESTLQRNNQFLKHSKTFHWSLYLNYKYVSVRKFILASNRLVRLQRICQFRDVKNKKLIVDVANWRFKFGISETRYSNWYTKFKIWHLFALYAKFEALHSICQMTCQFWHLLWIWAYANYNRWFSVTWIWHLFLEMLFEIVLKKHSGIRVNGLNVILNVLEIVLLVGTPSTKLEHKT